MNEKSLEDSMSFFVVKWNEHFEMYEQYSIRMSLENATQFCESRRTNDPEGDYKVHAELDF